MKVNLPSGSVVHRSPCMLGLTSMVEYLFVCAASMWPCTDRRYTPAKGEGCDVTRTNSPCKLMPRSFVRLHRPFLSCYFHSVVGVVVVFRDSLDMYHVSYKSAQVHVVGIICVVPLYLLIES